MCNRVDAPIEIVNSSEDWYLKYSWSEEEENNFKNWLVGYFQKNKKAQRELYGNVLTGKELRRRVEYWTLDYGWTVLPIKTVEKTVEKTMEKTGEKTGE